MAYIADWYEHDKAAVAAGLLDVDDVDLGSLLRGEQLDVGDRELVISSHTLIRGDYKVLVGNHYYAVWGAAVWPDRDTPAQAELKQTTLSCTRRPCLFNEAEDPSETSNLYSEGPPTRPWIHYGQLPAAAREACDAAAGREEGRRDV